MRIGYQDIVEQLDKIFFELIFRPLAEVLGAQAPAKMTLTNADEDWLRDALRTGRVQYSDGTFSGRFSARISGALKAIGARLDSRTGTFRLSPEKVPSWVSAEAGAQRLRAKDIHDGLKTKLDEIQRTLDEQVKRRRVDARAVLGRVETGFQTASRKLEVRPVLTEASRAKLSDDYSTNMELWIKDWVQKNVEALRQDVEKSAMEGYRYDALRERIEHRYGASKNKAKFLARQETALFMAKFRRERFQESGVRKYIWRTSHDERVRGSHKDLNGRVFFYNDPPIVDPKTGRKGNPGEDFGCRCVDEPVLDPTVSAEAVAS